MVPLTAVSSEFAGRVLVAKLGSAGILAELRGVSRVYPSLLGEPHVWVEAEELSEARELITTDLEDAFDLSHDPSHDPSHDAAYDTTPFDPADRAYPGDSGQRVLPPKLRPALVAIALLLLVSFGYGARSCSAQTVPSTSRAR